MKQIQLYLSQPHVCSYLAGREAKTLFLDPLAQLNGQLYGELLDLGFRRSGTMIYRPECDACHQCLPTRVPVALFQPRRSQRRIREKWRSAEIVVRDAGFRSDHFDLFLRYLGARHSRGGMDDTDEQKYIDFLTAPWIDTLFVEFKLKGQLTAVAVTDRLAQGLSAVYTFFDPDLEKLSPGVFAILWQIEETRRLGLRHLYLGYLVPGCRKMEYKSEYRPLQFFDFREQRWLPFNELSGNYCPSLLRPDNAKW